MSNYELFKQLVENKKYTKNRNNITIIASKLNISERSCYRYFDRYIEDLMDNNVSDNKEFEVVVKEDSRGGLDNILNSLNDGNNLNIEKFIKDAVSDYLSKQVNNKDDKEVVEDKKVDNKKNITKTDSFIRISNDYKENLGRLKLQKETIKRNYSDFFTVLGRERSHFVISDLQITIAKKVKFQKHLKNIALYLLKNRPAVLIMLGDFFDMTSLDNHDEKRRDYDLSYFIFEIGECRKLLKDFIDILHNAGYFPEIHFIIGNHEFRIKKNSPSTKEWLEYKEYEKAFGFEELGIYCHDFLDIVEIDGLLYSHYFTSGASNNAITTPSTALSKTHMSCVCGHSLKYVDHSELKANGEMLNFICAGISYPPELAPDYYKQGNRDNLPYQFVSINKVGVTKDGRRYMEYERIPGERMLRESSK